MASTLTRAAAVLRSARPADPRTDADLLARFLRDGDEAAFAALVDRHGPMVLGVCRRVLGAGPDTDDAFQGTFLVLVRQARSKAWQPALGPWLYGVAVRVARKARASRARRRATETPLDPMPHPTTTDPAAESGELLTAFDAELAALPEVFRRPVVLCELQGRTREQAARELGVSEGTLSSRLARGRKRLRERLARRGFGPAVAAGAAVPAGLRAATVELAKAVAAGAAGAVPAGVSALMEGVVKTMVLTKWKVLTGLVAAAVAATGFAVGAGDPPRPGVDPRPLTPPAGAKPAPAEAFNAPIGFVDSGAVARSDPNVVATIFGDVPVARQEFADYLIRKYGAKEIELFVNKRLLEHECARRGITVTAAEVQTAFDADLKGLNVTRDDFVRNVLPRYGKTETEWREDVLAPRLMMEKLCKSRVTVTDEDLRRAFETEFGERRTFRAMTWSKGTDRAEAEATRERIARGEERFGTSSRPQTARNVAAIVMGPLPAGRYQGGEDNPLYAALFALKRPGDVSPVVETADGLALVQLVEVIPPDPGRTFEAEKPGLLVKVTQAKIGREVPRYFAELKKQAKPEYHIRPAKAEKP